MEGIILSGFDWFVILLIFSTAGWLVRKAIGSKDILDAKQSTDIETLKGTVATLKTDVEVLKEIKMSEAQTREIVFETVDPINKLLQKQNEKINDKMDELLDRINSLALSFAKVGLIDRRTHDD